MKFTKSWALQMLDLNPDWMAIAVDKGGYCHWYLDKPEIDEFAFNTDKDYGDLGKFTYDGDWKDTLVVRKCEHLEHLMVLPKGWKYCPKCGELLGSKQYHGCQMKSDSGIRLKVGISSEDEA